MSKAKMKATKLNVEYKQQFSDKEVNDLLTYSKVSPSAVPLEEAILGAIMVEQEAFSKVNPILTAKHFYKDEHQLIWQAFEELHKNREPIDMLTTSEKLRKLKKLEKIGGPYQLVELTNRVASSANIEAHAHIVYRKWLRRDSILVAHNILKKAYDDSHDVFDVRNRMSDELRVMPPQSFFKVNSFEESIEKGKLAPKLDKMCGTLWNKTEVAFLFAPPGTGKTILAIQIAIAISEGKDVIKDILVNECEPQKVLYIDFELTDRNIADRYTNKETDLSYEFHNDNLKRVSINPDFLDFDKRLDKIAESQIENLILIHKPDCIVVDNITFLTNEGAHDTDVAVKIMKKLSFYKRKYNLSMLVLAHTTKSSVSKFMPLTERDMAGSGQLQNFADAIIGLKASAFDQNLIYLKQFKDRSEPKVHHEENVLVMEIDKGGIERNFLQMQYNSVSRETAHIAQADQDQEELFELQMHEAAIMLAEKKVKGIRTLKEEIGWKGSKNTLASKLKKYVEKSAQFKYNDRGSVIYADKGPF